MNPQMQFTKPLENPEIVTTDTDSLVKSGFTPEEVVSMLYLRQWYQTGGSDRVEVIRRLEFLKLMVMSGKIELQPGNAIIQWGQTWSLHLGVYYYYSNPGRDVEVPVLSPLDFFLAAI